MITRLTTEVDLEEENLRLRVALLEAQTTIMTSGSSINGAGSSWLQRKCSVQRMTLRKLHSRVRCQRLILGLVNDLGRLPSEQELKVVYDQMKTEDLDPVEAARAVNTVL